MTSGIHVYCGRGGLTASRARELRAHGVRGVVLCSEAVDGWVAPSDRARSWGAACAAAGLEVGVYAFPGVARARQPRAVAADLLRVLRAAGGTRPIADVEAPYSGRGDALVALLDTLDELATPEERRRLAVTTLGLPSAPGRWPWPRLIAWLRVHPDAELWWQCYQRASVDRRVDAGVRELVAAIGPRVVPHVRSYDTTAPDLVGDLDRACARDGRIDVTAAAIWSDASLDAAELDALRGWVARVGW